MRSDSDMAAKILVAGGTLSAMSSKRSDLGKQTALHAIQLRV